MKNTYFPDARLLEAIGKKENNRKPRIVAKYLTYIYIANLYADLHDIDKVGEYLRKADKMKRLLEHCLITD